VFDQICNVSEVEAGQAPLPGTKGQVTMQVLNADPVRVLSSCGW